MINYRYFFSKTQAYLCGVEPFCDLIGSQEALQRAKENVERNDFLLKKLILLVTHGFNELFSLQVLRGGGSAGDGG